MEGQPASVERCTDTAVPTGGGVESSKHPESHSGPGGGVTKRSKQRRKQSRKCSKEVEEAFCQEPASSAACPQEAPQHHGKPRAQSSRRHQRKTRLAEPAQPIPPQPGVAPSRPNQEQLQQNPQEQSVQSQVTQNQNTRDLSPRNRSTCDRSTQTDAFLTPSSQTQETQTHSSQATETKSTQTSAKAILLSDFKLAYQTECPRDPLPEENRRKLTVLSWNIDGLDGEDMTARIRGLLSYLGKHRPDVVLLQELITLHMKLLPVVMTDYEILHGNDTGYFVGILLRKSRVQCLQSDVVKYPTTEMGRNLLIAQVSFCGHQLSVMTSHLESCKDSSQERQNQLRRVWKRMREAADHQTAIFGGDTNLRDREVRYMGGVPDGISDVWEALGNAEDCRYTWDTVANDNKGIDNPIRLRFDRMYLRPAKVGAQLTPESMCLVGLERLDCGSFISDHWGILCTFSY